MTAVVAWRQPDGSETINQKAISEYVDKHYPLPKNKKESPPYQILPSGEVELQDGTVRPPKNGDVVPGPAIKKNPRIIPRSAWKCS
jgi:hypothetical protein